LRKSDGGGGAKGMGKWKTSIREKNYSRRGPSGSEKRRGDKNCCQKNGHVDKWIFRKKQHTSPHPPLGTVQGTPPKHGNHQTDTGAPHGKAPVRLGSLLFLPHRGKIRRAAEGNSKLQNEFDRPSG